jgi:hypothetical protein
MREVKNAEHLRGRKFKGGLNAVSYVLMLSQKIKVSNKYTLYFRAALKTWSLARAKSMEYEAGARPGERIVISGLKCDIALA